MFYYRVYVCYGGQDGKTVCFKSDKDLGDDEDAIVEEAIALGKMDASDDEFVRTAEQTDEEDYDSMGGDVEWA